MEPFGVLVGAYLLQKGGWGTVWACTVMAFVGLVLDRLYGIDVGAWLAAWTLRLL